MVRLITMLAGVAAMLLTAVPAYARWGVGNGGDDLRLAFVNAKEHAAFITLRLQDRSLPMALDAGLRQWLLDHHVDLAADIAKSTHEWTLDAEETCAWTQQTPAAPVQLSFPTCRTGVASFDDAGQLLVHESVHHFGIGDESFADAVALAVYDTWRGGATDWVPSSVVAAPEERYQHSAVWTGSEMVVFGGLNKAGKALNTGARYDPVQDKWTEISAKGAPARFNQQAVWTGKQMIVWGGYVAKPTSGGGVSNVWQNSGAVWDSATDSWQALATPNGPAELSDLAIDERSVQTAVWTGQELIVFGGTPVGGKLPGGLYNPETGAWRALSPRGAPGRIAGHSAVWADDRLIVWGGLDLARNRTATGAAYDPALDKWTDLPTANAPKERDGHTAIWTGSQMIVFGGYDPSTDANGTGGVFDVAMNAWRPIRTEAVQTRLGHTALWTGSEMLVFGGKAKRFQTTLFNAVSAFNPGNMSWRIVDVPSAPSVRALQSAVWTGASMVVFGGKGEGGTVLGTGGVFYP